MGEKQELPGWPEHKPAMVYRMHEGEEAYEAPVADYDPIIDEWCVVKYSDYASALARADYWEARCRVAVEALGVAEQAISEFSHAQEAGPRWYTRGIDGMYSQVHTWLTKGSRAIYQAKEAIGDLPPKAEG